MEAGGAKSQEIGAHRREADREMKDRQERSDYEEELVREAFDFFRGMDVKDLVESEQLWREVAIAMATTTRVRWVPKPSRTC